jgi:large subunit ribosomal protein L29
MSNEERLQQLQQLRNELAREKAAISSGTRPENAGRIRERRKTIARILTIMAEKPAPKAQAKGTEAGHKPVHHEAKPAAKAAPKAKATKTKEVQHKK